MSQRRAHTISSGIATKTHRTEDGLKMRAGGSTVHVLVFGSEGTREATGFDLFLSDEDYKGNKTEMFQEEYVQHLFCKPTSGEVWCTAREDEDLFVRFGLLS